MDEIINNKIRYLQKIQISINVQYLNNVFTVNKSVHSVIWVQNVNVIFT